LTKEGWENLSLRKAWVDWIDEYVQVNPHGLNSRAAVVEFALKRLRDSTQDLSADQLRELSMLAAETYSRLEDIRKRGAQSPRTTAGKQGSR
jgi:hypothetical protein